MLYKLFHILCYCTASKVLLILVNLGIKIPYYPAVLSRRLKLSSDNVKAAGDKLLMNKFIRQNFGGGLTLKNVTS